MQPICRGAGRQSPERRNGPRTPARAGSNGGRNGGCKRLESAHPSQAGLDRPQSKARGTDRRYAWPALSCRSNVRASRSANSCWCLTSAPASTRDYQPSRSSTSFHKSPSAACAPWMPCGSAVRCRSIAAIPAWGRGRLRHAWRCAGALQAGREVMKPPSLSPPAPHNALWAPFGPPPRTPTQGAGRPTLGGLAPARSGRSSSSAINGA